MKSLKFLSAMLALVILLDTCSKSVIVANFLLNQKQIAKELCVMKNIPGNHCNGKCHLKKELQKENQRENKIPENEFSKYEVVKGDFANSTNPFNLAQVRKIFYYYNSKLAEQNPSSIFRPPSC